MRGKGSVLYNRYHRWVGYGIESGRGIKAKALYIYCGMVVGMVGI